LAPPTGIVPGVTSVTIDGEGHRVGVSDRLLVEFWRLISKEKLSQVGLVYLTLVVDSVSGHRQLSLSVSGAPVSPQTANPSTGNRHIRIVSTPHFRAAAVQLRLKFE
jgi:hypothetical protein